MAFRWQADDGPLIVLFGPTLASSTKNINVVKVGPPLTKLSGSVLGHVAVQICHFHLT